MRSFMHLCENMAVSHAALKGTRHARRADPQDTGRQSAIGKPRHAWAADAKAPRRLGGAGIAHRPTAKSRLTLQSFQLVRSRMTQSGLCQPTGQSGARCGNQNATAPTRQAPRTRAPLAGCARHGHTIGRVSYAARGLGRYCERRTSCALWMTASRQAARTERWKSSTGL